MHRSVKATEDKATRPRPGDDLLGRPGGSLTHAVTITGVARDVWPWLAHMGAGSRAGRYSCDMLHNGRRPSAAWIIPELRSLEVGMVFPALPGVADAFTFVVYELEHFLILGRPAPDGTPRATWAFVLEQRRHAVRLLVRALGAEDYSCDGAVAERTIAPAAARFVRSASSPSFDSPCDRHQTRAGG